jgi:serine/threonine protein kinase
VERDHAFKKIRVQLRDKATVRQLRRTVHAMARLPSTALVPLEAVYVLFDSKDEMQVVLQSPWMANGTLSDRMSKKGGSAGPLPVSVFRGLVSALACLHAEGVVHGDVSTSNFLLTEGLRPVLHDLEAARDSSLKSVTQSVERTSSGATKVLYTPGFGAPELFNISQEGRRATTCTDMYSLGKILRQLMYGVAPADEAVPDESKLAPRALYPNIDHALFCQVLRSLLHSDPAQRASAAVLLMLPQAPFAAEVPAGTGSAANNSGDLGVSVVSLVASLQQFPLVSFASSSSSSVRHRIALTLDDEGDEPVLRIPLSDALRVARGLEDEKAFWQSLRFDCSGQGGDEGGEAADASLARALFTSCLPAFFSAEAVASDGGRTVAEAFAGSFVLPCQDTAGDRDVLVAWESVGRLLAKALVERVVVPLHDRLPDFLLRCILLPPPSASGRSSLDAFSDAELVQLQPDLAEYRQLRGAAEAQKLLQLQVF